MFNKLREEIQKKQAGFTQMQKLFGENYFGLYLLIFVLLIL